MSLAIFDSDTAMVLSSPEASTTQSRVAWASKWLDASTNLTPVSFARRRTTSFAKRGCVLMPVPTAVPPIGRFSARRTIARSARVTAYAACAANPENSWPRRIGVASIRCVRPIFTTLSHWRALARRVFSSFLSGGSSSRRMATAAATCMAVGNVSLDDWPMLTWSLGCTGSLAPIGFPAARHARLEITSLTFMFVDVPEPVWKMSMGKCSIDSSTVPPSGVTDPSIAAMIWSHALTIRRPRRWSSFFSSTFDSAHAFLSRPKAWITGDGTGRPETGKFSTARCVLAP